MKKGGNRENSRDGLPPGRIASLCHLVRAETNATVCFIKSLGLRGQTLTGQLDLEACTGLSACP